ncbi:MAG: FAD-dependent thymidylate synthase [Clostridia bacterium]|nr:FAD-dependent thymidylate synthase [Clostridia bacterium]
MNIKLVNVSIPSQSTNIDASGSHFSEDEIKSMVGKIASICYTSKTYQQFFDEPAETSIKRANSLLKSGHHSPYDQVFVKLYISNATKITLMAFNGGRFYATEEGSDRYRPMKLSNCEQQDFDELAKLYEEKILQITPNPSKYVQRRSSKIALENARYCMPTDIQYKDIFYTASLRELNYMYNWAKRFDLSKYPNVCKVMLPDLKSFVGFMEKENLVMPNLEDHFDRGFAFFKKQPKRADEYGYNYCMSYQCSIACAGQMERHRFLNCHYDLPDNTDDLSFYMPKMLLDDLRKTAEVQAIYEKYRARYPQGSLGTFTESGNIQDFLRVLYERDCAMAQFEINQVVQSSLKKYSQGLKDNNEDIKHLLHYSTINAEQSPHLDNLRAQKIANEEYINMLEHYRDKQYCQANGHCKGDSCGWSEGMQFVLRRY